MRTEGNVNDHVKLVEEEKEEGKEEYEGKKEEVEKKKKV